MIFFCLLFLFLSCTPGKWQIDKINTFNEHSSKRIKYISENFISDIELEILFTKDEIFSYINLISAKIEKKEIDLKIIIENAEYEFSENLITPQRIKLSKHLQNLILETCKENKNIAILFEDFKINITPSYISKKMENNSFFKLISFIEINKG